MANSRFAYANQCLTATITASGSATGYPASYLASRARWKKWRSTTTTGNHTLEFDFVTSKTIKVIALVNWLAHPSGGTIKAEYWTGAAWAAFDGGTGLFSLPASNRTRLTAIWYTPGRSTTKIKITFTNTGAVNAYVEAGVVFAGDYFEPAVNVGKGFQFEYRDPSANIAAADGQEIALEYTKFLSLGIEYISIDAADKNSLQTMFDTVGATKPFLYALDPDDLEQTVYGRLLEVLPARHRPQTLPPRFDVPLSFMEVR